MNRAKRWAVVAGLWAVVAAPGCAMFDECGGEHACEYTREPHAALTTPGGDAVVVQDAEVE